MKKDFLVITFKSDIMNIEELNRIYECNPEKVELYDGVAWYSKPLKYQQWYKKNDINNILEDMRDLVENGQLAIKYDIAYASNKGVTPTVGDYKELQKKCDVVPVDGFNGILFSYKGRYIKFDEGNYWTSSCIIDDVDRIIPINMEVSNGIMRESTFKRDSARLHIMSIETTK